MLQDVLKNKDTKKELSDEQSIKILKKYYNDGGINIFHCYPQYKRELIINILQKYIENDEIRKYYYNLVDINNSIKDDEYDETYRLDHADEIWRETTFNSNIVTVTYRTMYDIKCAYQFKRKDYKLLKENIEQLENICHDHKDRDGYIIKEWRWPQFEKFFDDDLGEYTI